MFKKAKFGRLVQARPFFACQRRRKRKITMKIALTDSKRVLSELIFELAVTSDKQYSKIADMVLEAVKTVTSFSVAIQMEQIAAALIALIPANKPVLPGSLSARLSLLITSLQIAARKDQWSQSVDRTTGTVKYFPCTEDVYAGHCPVCGAPLNRFGHRDRSLINETGEKETYDLRRLRCKGCGRTHIELLDCMVPYHHHSADVVETVLDGKANMLTGSQISEWNISRLRRRFADMGSTLVKEASGRVRDRLAIVRTACGGDAGWLPVFVFRLISRNSWRIPERIAHGAGNPLRKE